MIGRLTGSVEWRQARGEMGDGSAESHHSFIANTKNIEEGYMEVTYSSANNSYIQSGVKESMYDWQAGGFNTVFIVLILYLLY